MKIYEKVVAVIAVATFPAELIALAGIAGTASTWAWWVLVACAVLQLTAMAIIKIGDTLAGEKCILFWKRERLTYRQRLEREEPLYCNDYFLGGCAGCPGDYWEAAPTHTSRCNRPDDSEEAMSRRCAACWDQEAKA